MSAAGSKAGSGAIDRLGFHQQQLGHLERGATWVDVSVGDFNGDGLTDIVGRVAQNGQWWAALSNSTSFTNQLWTTWAV